MANDQSDNQAKYGEVVTRPDPTRLTTDHINLAVATLDTSLRRDVESKHDASIARMDAMDEATKIRMEIAARLSADLEKYLLSESDLKIAAVVTRIEGMEKALILALESSNRLTEERFHGIEVQFKERDVRSEQTDRDGKIALNAALSAAEKAVEKQNEAFSLSITKSEAATIKQIDQLGSQFRTEIASATGKIEDLKDRTGRMESYGIGTVTGTKAAVSEHNTNNALLVSVVMVAVVLIGIVADILSRVPHA